MPDIERDLREYLDAVTERVAAAEPTTVEKRSSTALRRGWWVAAAAVIAVTVVAVGLLSGDDRSTDPDEAPVVSEPESEEPRPDTSTHSEQEPRDPALPPPLEFDELGDGWRELPDEVSIIEIGGHPIAVRDSSARLLRAGERLIGVYPENQGNDVTAQVWDTSLNEVRAAAPSGVVWRANPTIVWTGEEVLIMGGSNGPGLDPLSVSYDPSGDEWRTLASPPGIDAGINSALGQGIWTGSEVVFWQEDLAYDPAADAWHEIAPSPLSDRAIPAVVAVDGQVWVWGGCPNVGTDERCASDGTAHADGAIYDPDADRWRSIADGGPTPGAEVHAVWTGSEALVVTGRHSPDPGRLSIAAYDPVIEQWRDIDPPEDEYGPLISVTAGAPGVVVVGGSGPAQLLDPASGTWRQLGDPPLVALGVAATWVDDTLVVTGAGRTVAFDAGSFR